MLVFLAMPYTNICDENLIVKDEYKNFFLELTKRIKEAGWEYFLAHERESWGEDYISDTESTKIDFETIKKCDVLCIVPGYPISGGVHVEMGWASANNKKMNIFLKENEYYSPMVTGLSSITDASYYYYKENFSEELIESIINSLK